MAESRGSLLAKSVQKHAGRAKEKILQNLGKVDRTADEIFDEHLLNFTRQQNAANKLQKEFSNYIRCIRATQAASKTLLDAIGEIYENQWTGHDLLYVQGQSVDMLWQDYSAKLADQVLLPLNTYQGQFSEMRKKIDKRGRKLVDYDSQRHSFQALQTNIKKKDDIKISKGREQLEEAKRTYEILNSELHDELPALYDSRILFLVTSLQSLFNAENIFHSESSKVFNEMESIADKLATESQRGSYTIKKTNGASPHSHSPTLNSRSFINEKISPTTTISENKFHLPQQIVVSENYENFNQKIIPAATDQTPALSKQNSQNNDSSKRESLNASNTNNTTPPPKNMPAQPSTNNRDSSDGPIKIERPKSIEIKTVSPSPSANNSPTKNNSIPSESSTNNDKEDKQADNGNNKKIEELYDVPVDANTANLPAGVLYKVKATYKYNREDVDELSFDVGEIIQVIEYDDPDEQEEGWLMGMKESNGDKGMFPANFTRPL